MHGKNPIRPPVKGSGDSLDVQRIFPTLQGEGPYAGWPAVFIRLGGCNLACTFCDTEFESFHPMTLAEIMARVRELATSSWPELTQATIGPSILPDGFPYNFAAQNSGNGEKKTLRRLIVITGGEPLRQPIEKLCAALIEEGFKVQIETNGTLWRELPEGVEIVCSPKNTGQGYRAVRPDLRARVNAFKFIVSASDRNYAEVGEVGQGAIPVYVQPMDEYDEAKNEANRALAKELAVRHGYRLSLQLHKILGME